MIRCTILTIGIVIALVAAGLVGAARAQEARRLCVLVPHFKDDYWLSVGYGLEREAARRNVQLRFFEAGGYRALAAQLKQLEVCAQADVDGILIGAVSSDHPDMTAAVARAARQVPVIALVNELHAEQLAGRIGVDWRDMGHEIGAFLSRQHPEGAAPKTAIFLNGPREAGWTGPLESGLRAGLENSSVDIVDVLRADTGVRAQLDLVEAAMARHADVDYVIGNAPAIEAALGVLATQDARAQPLLVSTYMTPSVLRGLINGQVRAAPFDDPVQQGVMAIRHAVSGGDADTPDGLIGPALQLLTAGGDSLQSITFPPATYFPLIE